MGNKELILVLGGARSGKSSWALGYSEDHYESRLFIATARPTDPEMEERIKLHRESRSESWNLLEAPIDVPGSIHRESMKYDVILIDCLTVWLNNILFEKGKDSIQVYEKRLIDSLIQRNCAVVVVSNEVGYGVVPDNNLARSFRDHCGRLNQKIASIADSVVLIVAGIPLYLKKDGVINRYL